MLKAQNFCGCEVNENVCGTFMTNLQAEKRFEQFRLPTPVSNVDPLPSGRSLRIGSTFVDF